MKENKEVKKVITKRIIRTESYNDKTKNNN